MIENPEQLKLVQSFFRQKLMTWWQTNARSFSWRQSNDKYEILIAELLLRRTNAPAAHNVYCEFIAKYPTKEKLAFGNLLEIEALAAKLGLFWRAKNIVQLASYFRKGGAIPENLAELSELPGVGPYVARAVMVNALKEGCVPVDSNVVRVICRFLGLPVRDALRRNRQFQRLADSFQGSIDVKKFNHALLDFSALVCTAKSPKCSVCPLFDQCKSAGMGI